VKYRCIGWLALVELLAATASCETFFSLDGLTADACDAGCGADGSPMPGRDASLDDERGTSDGTADGGATEEDGSVEAGAGHEASSGDDGASVQGAGGCSCVGAAPASWQGPVAVWEGESAPPACPSNYPTDLIDVFAGVNAAPAACTCSCGAPSGATCPSSFTATIYSDHQCGAACDTVTLSDGACTNVQGVCNNAFGISVSPAPTSGGSCAPQASTAASAWSWTSFARGCAPSSPSTPSTAGCDAGRVCISPAPPGWRSCVYSPGDVACPAGSYSARHVYYGSATDDRGCAPCSCGAPTGVTCAATVMIGCGTAGQTFAVPTSCTSLTDPGSVQVVSAPASGGGSCAPSGGEPTGSVSAESPTTICCTP
jgi:hypothetical protein